MEAGERERVKIASLANGVGRSGQPHAKKKKWNSTTNLYHTPE